MDTFSRFKNTPISIINGTRTYGRWVRPDFMNRSVLEDNQIQKIVINQSNAGRPDVIAYDLYGSDRLDWVIVMFNRPLNTLGWPIAGTVIEAPTRETVYRNL
jgi:hypothetical protein